MIPRIESTWQENDWQAQLANAITDPATLISQLKLPKDLLPAARQAAKLFPLKVTQSYLARIQPGNPDDPLLRQVLPLGVECLTHLDFNNDPVGDQAALVAPGLLHKYRGRVLLMTTQACGIHCRYCFRRHYPYQAQRATENWRLALEYIEQHDELDEVILSGGDPLSLANHKLEMLLNKLNRIPHIRRLRIHSRYPITLPQRIDSGFLAALHAFRREIITVVHANHPHEINRDVIAALLILKNHRVTLLNQSVLLRGVNDDSDTLVELQHALFESGVIPYYLHRLDHVQGAHHFALSNEEIFNIYAEIQSRLPGYLVPKLVTEVAGEASKRLLNPF